MEFSGDIEGVHLLPLNDIEAKVETVRDMCASYTEFETADLEGIFKRFKEGEQYEI